MFTFNSIGTRVETSINNKTRPYIFKISSQVHHLMGLLLLFDRECLELTQLCIYDAKNKADNIINALNCSGK